MATDNDPPDKEWPIRHHYIPEWAEDAGLKRADIARATGADKATVTRWFQGKKPQEQYLIALAAVLKVEVPELFLHPTYVWISRFLEGRRKAEVERIKATLEAAFPRESCESRNK